MAKRTRVLVKKEIYLWAIKESHRDYEEIKTRFSNIENWINQKTQPTFRQLEDLANYLKVPFGYMFLDKPPISDIIESEFRTIGNKVPNISKNLKDTIYEMSRKQDWISEYRQENGWDKIIIDGSNELNSDNYVEYAKIAKEFLMPESHARDYWNKDENSFNQIKDISKIFNVSKLALAIRLKELDLIDSWLIKEVSQSTEKDLKNRRPDSTGGDYWITYKSRYSNNFIETVIEGAESGEISHGYAFSLLDVKAKGYDILKEDMMRYG